MALIEAHLNAGIILVVRVLQYVHNLSLLPPVAPSIPCPLFNTSLISLVVSVDVKHHVY